MRKALFAGAVLFMAVLTLTGQANGSGYNSEYDCISCHNVDYWNIGPHVGYTAVSNFCKTCHAVHQAEGTYKLTRANTAEDACDYCHVGPASLSFNPVYNQAQDGEPTTATNGHTIALSAAIPDNPDDPAINLLCVSCHSVHGAKAIEFGDGKRMILKNDPLTSGSAIENTSTYYSSASTVVRAYCQKCHSANQGSASHPYAPVDNQHAWSGSQTCDTCHNVTGEPHAGVQTGYRMLTGRNTGANVGDQNLDDQCRRCHLNATSANGVGASF